MTTLLRADGDDWLRPYSDRLSRGPASSRSSLTHLFWMDDAHQRHLWPWRLRPLTEVFQRVAPECAGVGGGGGFWAIYSAADGGLRVGGEPIPFDPTIDLDDAALEWFLGRVPRHSGGVAEYGQFTTYWDHEPADDVEVAQMARAYLLYLFGASLFPLRRSRVHLSYLAGLVDLRQAGRFDWGGAALCTLYCFLGAASRGVGDTIGGYWRVIELWAYEVLGMFPPENTCTNPHLLPRALAWGKEYRRAKERRGQVMTFRRWLDNITGVTVHWDRWARMEADFLLRSREVTRSRVLLECPLGWQWYLGDRVTRQLLGSPEFIVSGPLLPREQRTETYTRAELEQFTVPDTDLERYLRRTLDYAAYRDRHLATSLGVEKELERRVAEAEVRRARGEAGGEIGDEARAETGGRGRDGRSSRGRERGAGLPAGGRGAGFSGRGESSTGAPKAAETPTPPGLPTLDWVIGVRDPSAARAMLDIPRLP
ncbi:hypothetical protein RHMOL_Rhmol01G0093900 [Rhododendron molle]|uniref:Uncharacterized protein n=1 Tax=Rhododendron molle TaxID=49168 RepID=A0ACC0Q156_RHOML|nr:hypothetical protein RHMOL_Rhmol01G0093900 [Rhododendron molle]